MIPMFKELDEELVKLRERPQDHAAPEVNAETVIEWDDELLTAHTELPSDAERRRRRMRMRMRLSLISIKMYIV